MRRWRRGRQSNRTQGRSPKRWRGGGHGGGGRRGKGRRGWMMRWWKGFRFTLPEGKANSHWVCRTVLFPKGRNLAMEVGNWVIGRLTMPTRSLSSGYQQDPLGAGEDTKVQKWFSFCFYSHPHGHYKEEQARTNCYIFHISLSRKAIG